MSPHVPTAGLRPVLCDSAQCTCALCLGLNSQPPLLDQKHARLSRRPAFRTVNTFDVVAKKIRFLNSCHFLVLNLSTTKKPPLFWGGIRSTNVRVPGSSPATPATTRGRAGPSWRWRGRSSKVADGGRWPPTRTGRQSIWKQKLWQNQSFQHKFIFERFLWRRTLLMEGEATVLWEVPEEQEEGEYNKIRYWEKNWTKLSLALPTNSGYSCL